LGILLIPILAIGEGRQAQSAAQPVKKRPLESHLRNLIGSNAIDCGKFMGGVTPEEYVDEAIQCALKAQSNQDAFFVVEDIMSIDSAAAVGFAGKTDGTVFRFGYDSAPCDGPQCPDSFNAKPCASPKVIKEGRRVKWACE